MPHYEKLFATKPDKMNLIPQIHVLEEENQYCGMLSIHTSRTLHKIDENKQVNYEFFLFMEYEPRVSQRKNLNQEEKEKLEELFAHSKTEVYIIFSILSF